MTTTSFGKWFVQKKKKAAVRIIIIYYYYMHVILLFRPAGKYDLNEDFDLFFLVLFPFLVHLTTCMDQWWWALDSFWRVYVDASGMLSFSLSYFLSL